MTPQHRAAARRWMIIAVELGAANGWRLSATALARMWTEAKVAEGLPPGDPDETHALAVSALSTLAERRAARQARES